MNIATKIYAILLNQRLQDLADRIVPESQVGFRPEHGSTDGVGVIRRIFECFRTMHNKAPELGGGDKPESMPYLWI